MPKISVESSNGIKPWLKCNPSSTVKGLALRTHQLYLNTNFNCWIIIQQHDSSQKVMIQSSIQMLSLYTELLQVPIFLWDHCHSLFFFLLKFLVLFCFIKISSRHFKYYFLLCIWHRHIPTIICEAKTYAVLVREIAKWVGHLSYTWPTWVQCLAPQDSLSTSQKWSLGTESGASPEYCQVWVPPTPQKKAKKEWCLLIAQHIINRFI